jgi:hypothetical protein
VTPLDVPASPAEYLALELRAHALLQHVPLYDVSLVEWPGGGSGRSLADIRTLDAGAPPSWIAGALDGLRYLLGRVFGWDDVRIVMSPAESRRPVETPGRLPGVDKQRWLL